MCHCDFISKYFIQKLDMKSFVPTSFYVSCDVPNIKNKVLNGDLFWEKALLVPALCLFPMYIKRIIFKSGEGNSLDQNRFRHVRECPKICNYTNRLLERPKRGERVCPI